MATEGTKFQVNFKLYDGTLINLYAQDAAELEAQLATIRDSAGLIGSTQAALSSNSGGVAAAVAGLGATVISTSPASNQPTSYAEGQCKHGALVWRESKPGAPKAWKGWFCPSPKGTPDQCEPKFVR
jgi:hypothetical protein